MMKKNRASYTSRLLVLSAACFGCGVAALPAQAGLFSVKPDKEKRMGDEAARAIEAQTRIVSGPVADWVERVGARLAKASNPEFAYSFRVIDSPEINAFALPAGYVYVNTGLSKIARNDDELAAVLAHEITHAEQHHFARQYSKASKRGAILGVLSIAVGMPSIVQNALGLVDFAMTQRYSRVHEDESDRLGMERMARAGFNPQGMVTLLERLDRQDGKQGRVDKWFASHPDGAARAGKARQLLSSLKAGKVPTFQTASDAPETDDKTEAKAASAQEVGEQK
jgi:predicted Zn-dependent protease